MCGIAGYFGTKEIPQKRIEGCRKLMHRRGPDHADIRTWRSDSGRNAVMLHSRLRIIDFDARANQPFRVGSKSLVYNGEVYNYLELRDELRARGVEFTTKSDTETIPDSSFMTGNSFL